MSEGHALLSPSAAARWLNCTPAPRLEATIPEKVRTCLHKESKLLKLL